MNRYPQEPGFQRHSETSRIAAESVNGESQCRILLEYFRQAGPYGLTCDGAYELAQGSMTISDIEYGTVSARMVTMKANKMIVSKGERRKTRKGKPAEVYVYKTFSNDQMALDF